MKSNRYDYPLLAKFKKQYKKLPYKLQLQFDERVQLFAADPTLSPLKVHPLKGKSFYSGLQSRLYLTGVVSVFNV